jgi:hypothetical protein
VSERTRGSLPRLREDVRRLRALVVLAGLFCATAGVLASAGDLRQRPGLFLAGHALLATLMLAAWGHVRRRADALAPALVAALLFRLAAAAGEPALSDDVYRYVWDGRVQLHGFHPYRYSPADPALAELRDPAWSRINHPEIRTAYPPLAQATFLLLAWTGAGPRGFKLALGLADFGVALALHALLRRLSLPRDRVVLYAWNPLAVLETAGSGHVEPVGVGLLLLAGSWIIDRRAWLSTLALAASLHVKLVPALLVPAHLRHGNPRAVLVFLLAVAAPFAAYAWSGGILPPGLTDYAERWEHNAFVYAGLERLLERCDTAGRLKPLIAAAQDRWGGPAFAWSFLHRHVWPRDVARLLVTLAVTGWAMALARFGPRCLARQGLLVLGAAMLLTPTLHPWYLLWILPLAAARCSPGWLVFGLTAPLAYAAGTGDVPWSIRCLEYLPPLGIMAIGACRRVRRFW